MRQCLVTGGAGFIGSHLVDGLLARGWGVRVLDDGSTGNFDNLAAVSGRIDLSRASVTDTAAVERATRGCEVVFHLAALPSVVKSVEDPVASHEICATGTLRVLDAARRLGVRRVVYAASSSAYGDQPGEFRTESDPLLPLSPYAAAKLAGEHYCSCCTAAYGLETVRLRFFNVFGPRQDARSPYSGVIALFLTALLQGKTPTIFGDGLQARDFVYVENVVEALLLAADAKAAVGQVYNIGMGRSITILDLVAQLNALLKTAVVPKHDAPRAGDIRFSCADITQARRELGYDPRISFADGLGRTLEWARRGGT
ncbi:MAG: NAD-dependent epimerase/dehydratase family protein [Gemmataceae bacterium]